MKKNSSIILFLASASLSLASHAEQWHFETKLSSYSNSESLPIVSLIDDTWQGDYAAADNLFSLNRFDISLGYGAWHVGMAKRFDYFATYSEQTMRLIYQDKNDIKSLNGIDYPIYLNVEHALSSGAFIRYENKFKSLDYRVTLNYWCSERLMSGQIDGDVTVNEQGKFSGLLNFDYSYDKDTLFK
ncbi:MAG: hypothetical protein HRU24_00115 [Gammaproteobacteria bacterium]|nr:hypothetical protein [Gammaproteobacteria bacterium]